MPSNTAAAARPQRDLASRFRSMFGMLLIGGLFVFPGCLQEAEPAAAPTAPTISLPINITETISLNYTGNLGNRVCLTSATMCFPMGGGGPAGGGMLTAASQNPRNVVVNGTPQSLSIVFTWAPAQGTGNTNLEVVVSAVVGTQGGGGGGGGAALREILRKAGPSPLKVDVADLAWKDGEGRLRFQLLVTNRSPNSAAYVGLSAGQPFTASGAYTTLVPAPEPTAPATNTTLSGGLPR